MYASAESCESMETKGEAADSNANFARSELRSLLPLARRRLPPRSPTPPQPYLIPLSPLANVQDLWGQPRWVTRDRELVRLALSSPVPSRPAAQLPSQFIQRPTASRPDSLSPNTRASPSTNTHPSPPAAAPPPIAADPSLRKDDQQKPRQAPWSSLVTYRAPPRALPPTHRRRRLVPFPVHQLWPPPTSPPLLSTPFLSPALPPPPRRTASA